MGHFAEDHHGTISLSADRATAGTTVILTTKPAPNYVVKSARLFLWV